MSFFFLTPGVASVVDFDFCWHFVHTILIDSESVVGCCEKAGTEVVRLN
jgi:hypothetical protein